MDSAAVPTPWFVAGQNGSIVDLRPSDAGLIPADASDLAEAFPLEQAGHVASAVSDLRTISVRVMRAGVERTAVLHPTPLHGGRRLCRIDLLEDEELVRATNELLDAAFETAPIGMALLDPDGCYRRLNAAMATLLGRDAGAVIGQRDLLLTHPDDRERDLAAATEVLNNERSSLQIEKRFVRPDGSSVWVIANLTFLRDQDGRPLAWVGQFTDVTAQRYQRDLLQDLADHDELTGLASRRAALVEIERLRSHVDRAAAVQFLDLDGFKSVNDLFGHAEGDRVLVTVAEALRAAVADEDPEATVGRLGGDEFVVVWPRWTAERVQERTTLVRDAVADATRRTLGTSVGTALVGRHTNIADLLADADRKMYADKRERRDQAGRPPWRS